MTSAAWSAAARAIVVRRDARPPSASRAVAASPVHVGQHARRDADRLEACATWRVPAPLTASVEAVRRYLAPTPVVGPQLGAVVSLKIETFQPTGSFKVRGGLAAVAATLDDDPGPRCGRRVGGQPWPRAGLRRVEPGPRT